VASEAPVPAQEAGHRVGIGHDRHGFGPGEPLRLGGVEIRGAPRLHGHSDGDVVLHAVADAILGAASLGDLGRLAPADARTPRGVASASLLELVLGRALAAGWQVSSLDVTIIGARPRLGDQLDAMRDGIAGLLSLPAGAVSVKGSTANLHGPEGEGRALAAEAIVVLVPALDDASPRSTAAMSA
jgi:2-C-methyl-D-erythritol 2,4-cyclodiphosphate synthase